jgi:beta-lactamase superfamily II metal-dependent hydrolase
MIEENVHFYTLNVGQKDSHVIHFPTRQAAAVIDPGDEHLIGKLLHETLEIKSLPLILISHFDLDHMAGLIGVINGCLKKNLKPGCIFFNDHLFLKSQICQKVKTLLDDLEVLTKTRGIETEYAVAKSRSSQYFQEILTTLGLEARILYPSRLQQRSGYEKKDYNLFSVLLYLSFAGKKILYSGDLPYAGWKEVDNKEDLKSDVFKVPHHGGNISGHPGQDMKKILEWVQPNFALITAGSNNSYDHPLPEVVEAIVSHATNPHLLCTQMTGQCSKNHPQLKEKIEAFYRAKIEVKKEFDILQLGSDNGTGCAGTLRVIFNKGPDIALLPSPLHHSLMLKTIFNHDSLLCRPAASGGPAGESKV